MSGEARNPRTGSARTAAVFIAVYQAISILFAWLCLRIHLDAPYPAGGRVTFYWVAAFVLSLVAGVCWYFLPRLRDAHAGG